MCNTLHFDSRKQRELSFASTRGLSLYLEANNYFLFSFSPYVFFCCLISASSQRLVAFMACDTRAAVVAIHLLALNERRHT